MPANLTPDYQRAEQSYREARTPEEKLTALEQMFATIPKHKGTEKMQADIKRRIAKLRADQTSHKKSKHVDPFHVRPSGAGQVVLIGTPNVGKSALVGALTNAAVHVGPYPFATQVPVPGMARFEDVPIQLVDMPPYTEHGYPPGMAGAIRATDVIALVIDASAPDVLEQVDLGLRLLRDRQIVPRRGADAPSHSAPVHHPAAGDEGPVIWEKPILVLVTKIDLVGAENDVLTPLRELYGDLEFLAVSAEAGTNLSQFVRRAFELLNVVRVYAKPPGKQPDMAQPFLLRRGSTVTDLAREIHRDFADQLKFARIWGNNKYPGQQVPHDHVLEDKDIVEVHV